MELATSTSAAAAAPAQSAHEELAQVYKEELAAERAPPKAEKVKEEPELAETEAAPDEAAPVEAEESEASEADDTAQAETDDGAETPTDDQSIAAPSGMSEADKTAYAKLPTEMKAWVAKQEAARTADYTRKSQAVAAHKQQFEAGLSGVTQRLEALDAELSTFTDNDIAPPHPELRNTDPMAYDDQLAAYMQAQHLKELAGKERQRVQAEYWRVSQAREAQFHLEREQRLREIAPELFSEKGHETGKQIQQYATKSGYTLEQLKAATAVDIMTLWKAQRFDAIEAAKKGVKTVPPAAMKASKPGPAKAVGRPSQLSNAVKTLSSNPSRDSLAAAYLAEIQSERR
jgi:hypothetical protein